MSQRLRTSKTRKRRTVTILWIAALFILLGLLIYFEQTALLYILATFGVTVLLVIVALADLGRGELSAETAIPEPATQPPGSRNKK